MTQKNSSGFSSSDYKSIILPDSKLKLTSVFTKLLPSVVFFQLFDACRLEYLQGLNLGLESMYCVISTL